jgi:hypothetical protein
MAILSKGIYRFNAIPIKIHIIPHRNRSIHPKIPYGNITKIQIAKSILSKKSKTRSITIPDFKVLQSHSNKKQHDTGTEQK